MIALNESGILDAKGLHRLAYIAMALVDYDRLFLKTCNGLFSTVMDSKMYLLAYGGSLSRLRCAGLRLCPRSLRSTSDRTCVDGRHAFEPFGSTELLGRESEP